MLLDATLKRLGEVDAISFTARRDDHTEVCVLVSGRATLEVEGREPVTLGAGDYFVTPRGWVGTGHVHQTVRNVYVIINDRGDSRSVTLGFARRRAGFTSTTTGPPPPPPRTACDAASVALPLRRGDRRCAACQIVAAAGWESSFADEHRPVDPAILFISGAEPPGGVDRLVRERGRCQGLNYSAQRVGRLGQPLRSDR